MRTTVTLDDDLAVRLEHARAERGASFKDVLNEAVRAGLAALETPAQRSGEPRRTRVADLGEPSIDVTNVWDAIAIAAGEDYR
jgi:hypothetical protein